MFRVLLGFIVLFTNILRYTLASHNCDPEEFRHAHPDVQCLELQNADQCKDECNRIGEKICQGQKGHIQKFSCTKETSILCCCETKCESLNKTMDRLNKALEEANIIQESYMCVSAKKTEIKEKLKEACRSETRVQIARKYCLEEHNGKYYCLKDGKCFGQLCRGCVKHECEVNGKKNILNPPEEYTQKVLASGFQRNINISNTINVQDRPDLTHISKWCTSVPNSQERTFEDTCISICADFGQKMCNSLPEEIAPTTDCSDSEDTCQCCCQPSCDESKRPICYEPSPPPRVDPPVPESTTNCTDDGFAQSYVDYEDYNSQPIAKPESSYGVDTTNLKNDVEEVASATTDFYDSLKTTYNPNYDYEKLTSQKAVKNDGSEKNAGPAYRSKFRSTKE